MLTQTSMTASDLFGMNRIDRDLEAPAELFVYPALLDASAADLPSSRAQGEVSVMRWIQPDPFLINGIRAYRAGDAERDVHWAATARTGELQVKTHDFTADPRLMVIINAQKGEDQWSDLMDYEQPQIEYAISLAATMCMNALEQGTEAGFAANMPLEEGGDCAVLLPARGAGRREEIMRAMACLLIRRIRSFPTFLEQLDQLHGMDILIHVPADHLGAYRLAVHLDLCQLRVRQIPHGAEENQQILRGWHIGRVGKLLIVGEESCLGLVDPARDAPLGVEAIAFKRRHSP